MFSVQSWRQLQQSHDEGEYMGDLSHDHELTCNTDPPPDPLYSSSSRQHPLRRCGLPLKVYSKAKRGA